MSDTELNIELFKKIRDRIAAIPESYDQESYVRINRDSPCGTAACLAGEAIICAAPTVDLGVRRLKRADCEDLVPTRAAKLLGLPPPRFHGTRDNLFGADNITARMFRCSHNDDYSGPAVFWPEPFASRFNKAKNQRGRARAAIAYLDYIISTGKAE